MIISNGCMGYWGFNEGTGSFFRDFSTGSFNTGSFVGSNVNWYPYGRVLSALSFSLTNANSYCVTSNLFSMSPQAMFAWINLPAYPSTANIHCIIGSGEYNDSNYALAFGVITSSLIYGTNGFENAGIYVTSASFVLPLNKWTFVGYNRQASSLDIWMNNTKTNVSYPSTNQTGSAGNPITIGASSQNKALSGYFQGFIDELRVYNRTLLDSEVLDLYNL